MRIVYFTRNSLIKKLMTQISVTNLLHLHITGIIKI